MWLQCIQVSSSLKSVFKTQLFCSLGHVYLIIGWIIGVLASESFKYDIAQRARLGEDFTSLLNSCTLSSVKHTKTNTVTFEKLLCWIWHKSNHKEDKKRISLSKAQREKKKRKWKLGALVNLSWHWKKKFKITKKYFFPRIHWQVWSNLESLGEEVVGSAKAQPGDGRCWGFSVPAVPHHAPCES